MSLLQRLMSQHRAGANNRPRSRVRTRTRTRTRERQIAVEPVAADPVVVNPDHVDVGLIPKLVAHDMTAEGDRMDSQARSGYIHVSSLPDLCPRAIALAVDNGNLSTLLKRVSSNDRIVWDMGRATERLVRDRIIESLGVDRVLGRWTCPCDGEEMYYEEDDDYDLPMGHHYVPCGCGRRKVSVYNELPLVSEEHGIIGNCDLPYWDEHGRLVITEIKSMKGEYFQQMVDDYNNQPTAFLRGLVSSHTFQASSYNRLFALQDYPVAPYVRILYVSKNYMRGTPYKEFVVPMNDAVNRRLDTEWNKARIIKEALRTGVLPERLPICDGVQSTRAKNCPMVVPCFARRG